MRSGGWSVQQALAADAAAVMRQAVSAARRRGHAQVTPLHVAAAALADGGGLLRGACLRSRCPPGSFSSHPALQCKALELCLNVALSRLATAAGGVFGSFQQQPQPRAPPALSNALAAALKRAQANQRRGGGGGSAAVEAAVAAKVELEQLVISILDDPSVSRVMREAGFSSAEVKANVEKAAAAVSSEPPPSPTNTASGSASPNPPPPNTKGAKPDVAAARVLDCMAASAGRKPCVVVVGESAAAAERVVKSVMDTVSKGEELELRHERLRNLQFVPLSFASFQRMTREEVEAGAGELRELVRRGDAAGKGVVLVLEDLGCAAEAWAASSARRSDHHLALGNWYCPVEHAVMELSRVMRDGDHDHDRFWVLAFGDHASYAVCKAGLPSLESVLEMHPVVVPQGGGLVALSLGGGDSELTFCGADTVAAAPASVPSWLHRCHGPVVSGPELTLSFSSPGSCASSISGFTQYNPNMIPNPWHDPLEQRQQLWPLNHRHDGPVTESHHHDQQWPASPTPGSYSSSASKSISSGGATSEAAAARRLRQPRFTELTAENLKLLCGALEARVPRHGGVAPGVASAVLRRRSGVASTRRRRVAPPPSSAAAEAATWLLFQGPDGDGKAAVARELARLVFGSYDAFTVIAATGFTNLPSRSGSRSSGAGEGELGRRGIKRPRSSSPEAKQEPAGYMQLFHDAIRENPHRVVLIDGIDDDDSEAGFIKSAIATGTVRSSNGVDVASLEDVIVVLSCEVFESWSRPAPSPRRRFKPSDIDDDGTDKGVTQPRFSLDLNASAIDDGELEEGGSVRGVELLDAVDGVFSFQ